MAFKLHMTVDLSMTSFYVHAHSDDVDLDFESVCKASPTCLRDFFLYSNEMYTCGYCDWCKGLYYVTWNIISCCCFYDEII